MKTRSFVVTLALVCSLVTMPVLLNAQFEDPDPGPRPTSVPFDGGLSLLIAAGVGFAAKKAHDKRKKENIGKDSSL